MIGASTLSFTTMLPIPNFLDGCQACFHSYGEHMEATSGLVEMPRQSTYSLELSLLYSYYPTLVIESRLDIAIIQMGLSSIQKLYWQQNLPY